MSTIAIVTIEKCNADLDGESLLPFWTVNITANGMTGLICSTSRPEHAELIKLALELCRDFGFPIYTGLTPGRNVKTLI